MTMESVQSLLGRLITFAYDTGPKSGDNIVRYSMYRALRDKLAEFDGDEKSTLAISHSANLASLLGIQRGRIEEANFPEFDILDLGFDDDQFDFVVSDQVLEHIGGSPYRAFSETARVLKPGGYFCHTTCLIMCVHGDPLDFWRFTPKGLEELTTSNGMHVVEAGGWGNREAWSLMHMGFWESDVPADPSNPINQIASYNEPRYPTVVWVIGQKPLVE